MLTVEGIAILAAGVSRDDADIVPSPANNKDGITVHAIYHSWRAEFAQCASEMVPPYIFLTYDINFILIPHARVSNSAAILVSQQGRKCTYVGDASAATGKDAVVCSDVWIDVKAVPLYYFEVYVRSSSLPCLHFHFRIQCRAGS